MTPNRLRPSCVRSITAHELPDKSVGRRTGPVCTTDSTPKLSCSKRGFSRMNDTTFSNELVQALRKVHKYLAFEEPTYVDDLTQETALRAWSSRSGFRGDSSVSTWVYRIAKHVLVDHRRARRRSRIRTETEIGARIV